MSNTYKYISSFFIIFEKVIQFRNTMRDKVQKNQRKVLEIVTP